MERLLLKQILFQTIVFSPHPQYYFLHPKTILILLNSSGIFVFDNRTNLYLARMRTTADLASMRANLIPTQFRGPAVKGIYEYGMILSLFSGINLSGLHRSGSG